VGRRLCFVSCGYDSSAKLEELRIRPNERDGTFTTPRHSSSLGRDKGQRLGKGFWEGLGRVVAHGSRPATFALGRLVSGGLSYEEGKCEHGPFVRALRAPGGGVEGFARNRCSVKKFTTIIMLDSNSNLHK
jgi:hypothetical protein